LSGDRILGANVLEEAQWPQSLAASLFDQFTNIMLVMLIAVAVVSGVLSLRSQEVPKDAIAIFAIVILNGVLGYFQESRAEKALAALKQMATPNVRVLRAGARTGSARPGSGARRYRAVGSGGIQVAADGRLLRSSQPPGAGVSPDGGKPRRSNKQAPRRCFQR
jgi:Ca2+-transporting ATPase